MYNDDNNDNSFTDSAVWLVDHFFVEDEDQIDPVWHLEHYNGLSMSVTYRHARWFARCWFNNEQAMVYVPYSDDKGDASAEAAVKSALKNVADWLALFVDDLSVTAKALLARISYDDAEAGFYPGMPGLE